MFQHTRINSDLNFFQKLKNIDYVLLVCIILLSITSTLVMYSTDGGEFLYHTKSHATKLLVFFIMMLMISFFNIKFWHHLSYFFYFVTVLLLIYVSIFWNKSFRISKMDRFILYCLTAFRTDENSGNIMFS